MTPLRALWMDASAHEQLGSGPFTETEAQLAEAFFYAGAVSVVRILDNGGSRESVLAELRMEADKHRSHDDG